MFRPNVTNLILFSFLTLTCALPAQVVINEIMYRPGTGFPENTRLEFIELHNPTGAPVNVSGWAITSGASLRHSCGHDSSPRAAIVVIAADPAQVQTAYGITGVLGPWAAGATLSNNGEKITLSKPGTVAGTLRGRCD